MDGIFITFGKQCCHTGPITLSGKIGCCFFKCYFNARYYNKRLWGMGKQIVNVINSRKELLTQV